jgi:hypothetical protein
MNTAGVDLTWDLNHLIVRAGYAHDTLVATATEFSYLDYQADQVSGSVVMLYLPTLSFGAFANASNVRYTDPFRSDIVSITAGPSVDWLISRNTHLVANAGPKLTYLNDDDARERLEELFPGFPITESEAEQGNPYIGPFANIKFENRLTTYYSHNVTVGMDTQTSSSADLLEFYFARYAAAWRMNRYITVNLGVGFEVAEEIEGGAAEQLHRWLGSIGFGYKVTKHLTASVAYRYTSKDSQLLFRDYRQNVASLSLRYDF